MIFRFENVIVRMKIKKKQQITLNFHNFDLGEIGKPSHGVSCSTSRDDTDAHVRSRIHMYTHTRR